MNGRNYGEQVSQRRSGARTGWLLFCCFEDGVLIHTAQLRAADKRAVEALLDRFASSLFSVYVVYVVLNELRIKNHNPNRLSSIESTLNSSNLQDSGRR